MTIDEIYERRLWPRLLLSLSRQEISEALTPVVEGSKVEDLSLPQSGLALLQLRDGALAENYFLGEIPLSRAVVKVTDNGGKTAEGACQILDDRPSLARDIAIIDAVLAGNLYGHEALKKLLDKGADRLRRREAVRIDEVNRTRVDFSLLDSREKDESDE